MAEIYSYNSTAALPCRGCGGRFKEEPNVVLFEERRFHVRCLKCADCGKKFGTNGDEARGVRGLPYCRGRCYLKASTEYCAGCGESILSGKFLDVKRLQKKYHVGCFKCAWCEAALVEGYQLRNKEPVCTGCFRKRRPGAAPISHPKANFVIGGRSALSKAANPKSSGPYTGRDDGGGKPKEESDRGRKVGFGSPSNRSLSPGRIKRPDDGRVRTASVPDNEDQTFTASRAAAQSVYMSPTSQPKAKFCGSCGEKADAENNFCGSCGFSLLL